MNAPDQLQTNAREIAAEVDRLIAYATSVEQLLEPAIEATHSNYTQSIRNLLHYLALRQTDLRELQAKLTEMGLSSLGRFESCVLATLNSVSSTLHRLAGEPAPAEPSAPVAITQGTALLRRHADDTFGPAPQSRDVRIMVTMPSEAADDPGLVSDLVAAGMDIARVNTAHDDLDAWRRMIENIRRASREANRYVLIEADLAGPKIRTGPLESGPMVQKYRPARGPRGELLAPARVNLVPAATQSPPNELPVDPELLGRAQPGDVLAVHDTRARWLRFPLEADRDGRPVLVVDRALYAETGGALLLERQGENVAGGSVGAIPPQRTAIRLHVGDPLLLTRAQDPGRDAERDQDGHILRPASIACVPPVALDNAAVGQSVWFDDGRISGLIESVDPSGVTVRITHANPRGTNLRAEKGINLPDTDIEIPAISETDLVALDALVHDVDLIGLSFVRRAADVELLQEQLARLDAAGTGIVLKIETRLGFSNLPQLLLTATRSPRVGVMVARGDLAVEIGFQRLAEVQEEILWLCEAAHIPVVWATQVLEAMARTGAPSRAEVTDAAMAERAECVMLNKGPYIVPAVSMLADVLRRMEAHQYKKRPMLRRLAVSEQLQALTHAAGQDCADDPSPWSLPDVNPPAPGKAGATADQS